MSAEEKGTGKKEAITITNDQNRLTPEDIEKMIQDAEKFAEEDKKVKEKVDTRNSLESYAYSLKTQIEDDDKLGYVMASPAQCIVRRFILCLALAVKAASN